MTETTLRPLRADEYDVWRSRSEAAYAQDMVESGGLDPESASRKAADDFGTLLAGGRETEGHDVYAIECAGESVGSLWLAERDSEQGRALFVYEVYVHEAARGQGHGRAAMGFAEEEARKRDIAGVSLNVFGGNDVARGLYRSLGYREVAVFMRKDL